MCTDTPPYSVTSPNTHATQSHLLSYVNEQRGMTSVSPQQHIPSKLAVVNGNSRSATMLPSVGARHMPATQLLPKSLALDKDKKKKDKK
jgi:hypothetical protein